MMRDGESTSLGGKGAGVYRRGVYSHIDGAMTSKSVVKSLRVLTSAMVHTASCYLVAREEKIRQTRLLAKINDGKVEKWRLVDVLLFRSLTMTETRAYGDPFGNRPYVKS
jgi:hypothetical protein